MRMPYRSLFFLLFAAAVLGAGCSARSGGPDPALQHQFGAMTYEVAVQVYQAGEYAKAAALFEDLIETTAEPRLRSKARFGLIAARLLAASNEEEYGFALGAWKEWSAEADGTASDPRLLPPVMAFVEQRAGREPPSPPPSAPAKVPDNIVLVEVEEMRRIQQTIREREAENERLRERIVLLERTALAASAPAAERLRWSESLQERARENDTLRQRIAELESTIAAMDESPRNEELKQVHAAEILRLVEIVEEKERDNLALRDRLSAVEQKLSGIEQDRPRSAQPVKAAGNELSRENQRLREKLEALEKLHQEMIERKRVLSGQ